MVVSSQLHVPAALYHEQNPTTYAVGVWFGVAIGLGGFEEEKISISLSGIAHGKNVWELIIICICNVKLCILLITLLYKIEVCGEECITDL
jgi:hypothetical protein